MFPFARGLYEDKVSNFWCASSLAIKWQRIFPFDRLVLARCGISTISVALLVFASIHVH